MKYEVEQANILTYSPYLWRVVVASESGKGKTVAMCEEKEHAELLAGRLNLDQSLKNMEPGKITLMPELATLRDQFAMAAMIAYSVQSAIIAVAYIAQGNVMKGDYPSQSTGAHEYYATADSMLEARK